MTDTKASLFFCAAPRSGSTQLAAWLDTHPEISLSAIKEPNFFAAADFDPDYVKRVHLSDVDPESYVARRSTRSEQFAIFRQRAHYDYLFESMTTPWRLDASTTYLHSSVAPSLIKEYNPDAVIILLTRHPVVRALSAYRLARQTGRTRRSLAAQIAFERGDAAAEAEGFLLRQSRYRAAQTRVRATFPAENIVTIRFEDMVVDPGAALRPIAARLGIDANLFDTDFEKRNTGDVPRFPSFTVWATETGLKSAVRSAVPPETRKRLRAFLFRKPGPETTDFTAERAALTDALSEEVAFYGADSPST
ncbi:MAG: sulfotransferase [Pseudomonadota bacterium]